MKPLRVGITGPNGFIAGHVRRELAANKAIEIVECERSAFENPHQLTTFVNCCDTVLHVAGMNRGDDEEIFQVNTALVDRLIEAAEASVSPTRVVFASTTQRTGDNPYGRSKRYGEQRLAEWAAKNDDCSAVALVIPNVFGPGCRPFYNSVVATFCHKLAEGETPTIIDDNSVEFIWVGDVAKAFADSLEAKSGEGDFKLRRLVGHEPIKVSELLAKLQHFHQCHFVDRLVPDISQPLDAQLYATLESYLPLEAHCHRPEVHSDYRGDLCEVLRVAGSGQVFFSTTKPGITRGNHYHTRKVEWFCVLKGEATIRLRNIAGSEVREFHVCGADPQFISIPVLHTHHIENTGETELLTMFWCNEIFDASDPDTYYEQVFAEPISNAA